MQKQSNFILFPFFLVFYEIASYLSNDAYLPALTQIAHDFSISHNLAQLTLTAWFLGALSVQFILGPLSDRYGRRPVLLLGGIVYVIASLACALSTTIHLFLIARFFQGAAIPSMVIAGYAAIHESFNREQAIHMLARMQSITILAPSFGPLLGGILLMIMNWHWIFAILSIWAVIALFFLFLKMPETLTNESRQEKIHFKKIIKQYYATLRNIKFMKYILSGSFVVNCLCAWMLTGPFLIIDKFHFKTIYFGLFQIVVFGSFIVGMRLIKKLMNDKNIYRFVVIGLSIAIAGSFLSVLLAVAFPEFLYGMISALMVIALGVGLCFPILNRLAIESSDEPMGIRMTVLSAIQMGSTTLATGVIALFYNGSLLSFALILFAFSSIGILTYFSFSWLEQGAT